MTSFCLSLPERISRRPWLRDVAAAGLHFEKATRKRQAILVELTGIEPVASSLRTTGPAIAIRLIPLSSATFWSTFSIQLLDQ